MMAFSKTGYRRAITTPSQRINGDDNGYNAATTSGNVPRHQQPCCLSRPKPNRVPECVLLLFQLSSDQRPLTKLLMSTQKPPAIRMFILNRN